MADQNSQRWYTRPVLFTADLHRALHFYLDQLGFEKQWHEADGAGTVCQVHRTDCEIILCQDASRSGGSRLFISLTPDALAKFRQMLTDRSIAHEQTWWGYDAILLKDPDGNELMFPLPQKA